MTFGRTLGKTIASNLLLFSLALLLVGFVVGRTTIRIAETDPAGEELSRAQESKIFNELATLIGDAQRLERHADGSPEDVGQFFALVRSFLNGLPWPKEHEYQGVRMSDPVFQLQMIALGDPAFGHAGLTPRERVARVRGHLKGLQRSFGVVRSRSF